MSDFPYEPDFPDEIVQPQDFNPQDYKKQFNSNDKTHKARIKKKDKGG